MTGKKRILIIDDEPDLLKALNTRFQAEGYDVITSKDGAKGLEKARKENPDLIILDLMLPKINGYRVCRFIKFDETCKHIPIIILTARVEDEDKKLGKEVGADYYMTKPFDNQELLDHIKNFIG